MDSHESLTPGQASQPDLSARVPRRYVGPSTATAPAPNAAPKRERTAREARAWDKLLLLVGAAVVVAAILIVPGILNQGGRNPVAQAAETTMQSPGVRMDFTFSFQGPASGTMHGTGVLNGETDRASMHMSISAGTAGFDMDEVLDGLDVYMHSPVFSGLAGGKNWLLVRASAFGEIPKASGGLGGGILSGPKQQLEAIESASGNVTTVGQEPVNGVQTTHYAAIVDLQKLMDEVRDRLPSRLADLLDRTTEAGASEKVDVWVDQQGLIRREQSAGSMGSAGSFSSTIDFSDYGSHPQIDVPPDSDVYDITPVVEHVLDGSISS